LKKVAIQPPSLPDPRPGDKRATKALTDEKNERIYFLGPARYQQGLNEITNLAAGTATNKALLMEAMDDLFKKYAAGEGRQEIPDLDELSRRLGKLGCIDTSL
jgi:hypothetical protein